MREPAWRAGNAAHDAAAAACAMRGGSSAHDASVCLHWARLKWCRCIALRGLSFADATDAQACVGALERVRPWQRQSNHSAWLGVCGPDLASAARRATATLGDVLQRHYASVRMLSTADEQPSALRRLHSLFGTPLPPSVALSVDDVDAEFDADAADDPLATRTLTRGELGIRRQLRRLLRPGAVPLPLLILEADAHVVGAPHAARRADAVLRAVAHAVVDLLYWSRCHSLACAHERRLQPDADLFVHVKHSLCLTAIGIETRRGAQLARKAASTCFPVVPCAADWALTASGARLGAVQPVVFQQNRLAHASSTAHNATRDAGVAAGKGTASRHPFLYACEHHDQEANATRYGSAVVDGYADPTSNEVKALNAAVRRRPRRPEQDARAQTTARRAWAALEGGSSAHRRRVWGAVVQEGGTRTLVRTR